MYNIFHRINTIYLLKAYKRYKMFADLYTKIDLRNKIYLLFLIIIIIISLIFYIIFKTNLSNIMSKCVIMIMFAELNNN